MKENVFDILIYLFEHYMLEDPEQEIDEEAIMIELVQAGFNHLTIDKAFDWLENLAIMCDKHQSDVGQKAAITTMRHYDEEEQQRISVAARGFLLSLEQYGILTPASREMVIDRLMALNEENLELSHIKWVLLVVLTNCTDIHPQSLQWTESLILESAQATFH